MSTARAYLLRSLERIHASWLSERRLYHFPVLAEFLYDRILHNFVLVGQCPNIPSGKFDLPYALGQFLHALPLAVLPLPRLQVGVQLLRPPHKQSALAVDARLEVLAQFQLHQSLRQVADSFGREILELEKGVRPRLVHPVPPEVNLMLRLLLAQQLRSRHRHRQRNAA